MATHASILDWGFGGPRDPQDPAPPPSQHLGTEKSPRERQVCGRAWLLSAGAGVGGQLSCFPEKGLSVASSAPGPPVLPGQQPPLLSAWRIPWTEEPGKLQSRGSQRVRQDSATITHSLSTHSFTCLPVSTGMWSQGFFQGFRNPGALGLGQTVGREPPVT